MFMSSSSSASGANKKKSLKDLQDEITNLYNNIRLFEKGTKFFSGKSRSSCAANQNSLRVGVKLRPPETREGSGVTTVFHKLRLLAYRSWHEQ